MEVFSIIKEYKLSLLDVRKIGIRYGFSLKKY